MDLSKLWNNFRIYSQLLFLCLAHTRLSIGLDVSSSNLAPSYQTKAHDLIRWVNFISESPWVFYFSHKVYTQFSHYYKDKIYTQEVVAQGQYIGGTMPLSVLICSDYVRDLKSKVIILTDSPIEINFKTKTTDVKTINLTYLV